ncbi:gamma-glutamyl-gamma-aminobutyrate hydrolase family protein [Pseudoduganella ginsengisoli]|uniref:gamma-glutamyl-gamma-aminobutyrate hydrolase n=1 Tax=Pseudoduganella ginsengisoli TaxID=1462440 RepID=A0A6L6PVP9_9BURK|nr:gamma-glutamyl-gamma-aminobutyrate hydrolase family protein [Pseudoduganella ginsengisoli]MTW01184.1 gamma-glutamyl-gamma-aminobutyrate hydrolase family protein [Pseudoduganella ginsengisoli]
MRHPIVLVPSCSHQIGLHPYYAAQHKYVDAVVKGAACTPVIVPALGEALDIDALLDMADGVMLTGSPSNVHASLYGQDVRDPSLPQDRARDATTLPLIRAALKRGVPLMAICRGFQEVNVALGGTLHQAVHDVPGMNDHRESKGEALDVQYAAAHKVVLQAGGMLARLLQGQSEINVNSLHGQGIDELAPGLQIEAVAEDGLVEAYSVIDARFALAVQWHPEWQVASNPVSMRLFTAFGDACRAHRDRIP